MPPEQWLQVDGVGSSLDLIELSQIRLGMVGLICCGMDRGRMRLLRVKIHTLSVFVSCEMLGSQRLHVVLALLLLLLSCLRELPKGPQKSLKELCLHV
jgi:hypothetical protein